MTEKKNTTSISIMSLSLCKAPIWLEEDKHVLCTLPVYMDTVCLFHHFLPPRPTDTFQQSIEQKLNTICDIAMDQQTLVHQIEGLLKTHQVARDSGLSLLAALTTVAGNHAATATTVATTATTSTAVATSATTGQPSPPTKSRKSSSVSSKPTSPSVTPQTSRKNSVAASDTTTQNTVVEAKQNLQWGAKKTNAQNLREEDMRDLFQTKTEQRVLLCTPESSIQLIQNLLEILIQQEEVRKVFDNWLVSTLKTFENDTLKSDKTLYAAIVSAKAINKWPSENQINNTEPYEKSAFVDTTKIQLFYTDNGMFSSEDKPLEQRKIKDKNVYEPLTKGGKEYFRYYNPQNGEKMVKLPTKTNESFILEYKNAGDSRPSYVGLKTKKQGNKLFVYKDTQATFQYAKYTTDFIQNPIMCKTDCVDSALQTWLNLLLHPIINEKAFTESVYQLEMERYVRLVLQFGVSHNLLTQDILNTFKKEMEKTVTFMNVKAQEKILNSKSIEWYYEQGKVLHNLINTKLSSIADKEQRDKAQNAFKQFKDLVRAWLTIKRCKPDAKITTELPDLDDATQKAFKDWYDSTQSN